MQKIELRLGLHVELFLHDPEIEGMFQSGAAVLCICVQYCKWEQRKDFNLSNYLATNKT